MGSCRGDSCTYLEKSCFFPTFACGGLDIDELGSLLRYEVPLLYISVSCSLTDKANE
jgi:hypothetical protein